MTQKFYAHSLNGKPPSDWQPLEEHLKNVAKIAAEFADYFDARVLRAHQLTSASVRPESV